MHQVLAQATVEISNDLADVVWEADNYLGVARRHELDGRSGLRSALAVVINEVRIVNHGLPDLSRERFLGLDAAQQLIEF